MRRPLHGVEGIDMKSINTGALPGDYRSPLIAKQRAFFAFARNAGSTEVDKRLQKDISRDVRKLADSRMPAGSTPVSRHQFSAVPRINPAEGECNWQVVVFLPVPSEVLKAIGEAAAELQGSVDMADYHQGSRALII